VFGEDAEKFINYSKSLLPLLDNRTREKVEHLIDEAAKALRAGEKYSAASLAFTSLLRAANYTATVRGFNYLEEALGITLSEALTRAEKELAAVTYEAGDGMCYSWRFAALSAASYRLYLAEHVSDEAGAYWRVLALLRALSAETWAKAAGQLTGPIVPCSFLEDTVNLTYLYARTAFNYLMSLINKPYVRILTHMIDNRTMADWLRDAENAIKHGDYPLAMGLTVYVLSEIEFRMDKGGAVTSNTMLSCLVRHFETLYSIAGNAFAVPAVYYHNYAGRFIKEANQSEASEITAFSMESYALTWLLPGLFLHVVSQDPSTVGEAYAPLATPWFEPYIVVAAEALLLAATGAAAARTVSRRHEI
jgi:uncharacterized protein